MNWKGTPLTSHDTVVNLIGAVTTSTGPTVQAELDTGLYPTGIKISDGDTVRLEREHIHRHTFHPDWNYTLHPHDKPDTRTRLG